MLHIHAKLFYSFCIDDCFHLFLFYISCNSSSSFLLNRKLLSNLVNPLKFMRFPWNKVFSLTTSGRTPSFDSSVGRAEDCRSVVDILRSLVRIRLEGIFYFASITDCSHATYSKLFYSFCIDGYFYFWYSLS